MADFANRETCSFKRLNDAFRKTLPQAPKKKSRNRKKLLPRVVISNVIVFYDKERIMGNVRQERGWGGGSREDVNSIFNTCFFLSTAACLEIFLLKISFKKKNGLVLKMSQMRLLLKNPGGTFSQIQTDIQKQFVSWLHSHANS